MKCLIEGVRGSLDGVLVCRESVTLAGHQYVSQMTLCLEGLRGDHRLARRIIELVLRRLQAGDDCPRLDPFIIEATSRCRGRTCLLCRLRRACTAGFSEPQYLVDRLWIRTVMRLTQITHGRNLFRLSL